MMKITIFKGTLKDNIINSVLKYILQAAIARSLLIPV